MATTTPTRVRRLLAATMITGVVTGAALAGAGTANADPRSPGHGRDTTGQHHIDRRGIHHQDADPNMRAEHDDARRDYYDERYGQPEPASSARDSSGRSTATWNSVRRGDGSGWVVCPRLSRTCG